MIPKYKTLADNTRIGCQFQTPNYNMTADYLGLEELYFLAAKYKQDQMATTWSLAWYYTSLLTALIRLASLQAFILYQMPSTKIISEFCAKLLLLLTSVNNNIGKLHIEFSIILAKWA